jgi:hypothetical protein
LVPKASYSRLAALEVRLDALAGEALSTWVDLGNLSDDDLRALADWRAACEEAGEVLPLPAALDAINRRMMTDPAMAEARTRAQWLTTGRDWGKVWRELV